MLLELSRMTTVEAAARLGEAAVAIIPIGATEQHGPHLELRTDIEIATRLSRRIAEEFEGTVALCPPLPIGCSEHHLSFAGTLSLRPATLSAVLRDLFASLRAHGISRVLIVNGHGGNTDVARIAAREAKTDLGMDVAHVMWGQLLLDKTSSVFQEGLRYHHACEVETSLAAACDPSLVREREIRPSAGQAVLDGWTDSPRALIDLPVGFGSISPTGALGDPSRMDVAWGAELCDEFVRRSCEFLRGFALVEGPPRSVPQP